MTSIWAAMPSALASPFSNAIRSFCCFMSVYIRLQDSSMWQSMGCCLIRGSMRSNHNTKFSFIALVNGWHVGPYATHNAEYLHLPFPNPAAFTAVTSTFDHSCIVMADACCPQVDLEYPAPENSTLARLVIFAIRYILLSVPLEFLILCFRIFFLVFGLRLNEKSIPGSLVVSAVLYVIPSVLRSCTRCLAAYGSLAIITHFVLSLKPNLWLIFANPLIAYAMFMCVVYLSPAVGIAVSSTYT